MEFLLHKDYIDSWHSELAETYGYRSWPRWRDELTAQGWTIDPTSSAYTNDWIVTNRLDPVASITDPTSGARVDWPVTHVRFAAHPPRR